MPHHTILHEWGVTNMNFGEMLDRLAESNISFNGAATVVMAYLLAYGPRHRVWGGAARPGVRGALMEIGRWVNPVVEIFVDDEDRNAGLVSASLVIIGLGAWIARARRRIHDRGLGRHTGGVYGLRGRDRADFAAGNRALVETLAGNNAAGIDFINGAFLAMAVAYGRRFASGRYR